MWTAVNPSYILKVAIALVFEEGPVIIGATFVCNGGSVVPTLLLPVKVHLPIIVPVCGSTNSSV